MNLIVATCLNNVIGKDNQLPWYLPADLKYFKSLTEYKTVVMGRNTYESIGKPLPNRTNVVVSNDNNLFIEGCIVVNSRYFDYFARNTHIDSVKSTFKNIFVIGGQQTYELSIKHVDTIYLTRILAEFDGDTYFNESLLNGFELVSKVENKADSKNVYDYNFEVWKRV